MRYTSRNPPQVFALRRPTRDCPASAPSPRHPLFASQRAEFSLARVLRYEYFVLGFTSDAHPKNPVAYGSGKNHRPLAPAHQNSRPHAERTRWRLAISAGKHWMNTRHGPSIVTRQAGPRAPTHKVRCLPFQNFALCGNECF